MRQRLMWLVLFSAAIVVTAIFDTGKVRPLISNVCFPCGTLAPCQAPCPR